MSLVETLKSDYQKFPQDQSYHLYHPDVYFKDPLSQFKGIKKYRGMITLMGKFFGNMKLVLHDIKEDQNQRLIRTEWTLSWNSPLPWKPYTSVSGYSELTYDENQLITSHIDYWYCSVLDLIKQQFQLKKN